MLNLHSKFTGNKPWTSRGKLNCSVCYAPIHFITFRIDVRTISHEKKESFYSKIRGYLHTAKKQRPHPTPGNYKFISSLSYKLEFPLPIDIEYVHQDLIYGHKVLSTTE